MDQVPALLAPFHLLFYSTLLGTELYQTFVMTKVCYDVLPRSAFTTLQKHIFLPPLFSRFYSIIRSKQDWLPFAVAGLTAFLNLGVYEPRTSKAMVDRIHQATRDSRQPIENGSIVDEGPSLEMQRLNRVFSKNHAMTIHLNLISIAAMLFYGWRLASRLNMASV
ncbi:hypothetical protein B0T25DRAFT_582627 [Lasiosphaeria hispida]|uniref:TMEM205-like domain-containing protein n=1 Tax=Lasiosphaeria hispida TaxID=260671 RepID=A0AAJ0MCL9_9PEZI|nr:hypothetical protein B0T25DRAFT_582627 [Lasiosphaeria hispida]